MARKFYKEDNSLIPAIVYELTQPLGYTQITNSEELKRLYIGLYNQRAQDGVDYFDNFRASVMMDIIAGTYTEIEVFNLETHIKYLQDEVILGNWLTAQNTNSNLALSGIYDQAMKDEIQTYIDDYVLNNY